MQKVPCGAHKRRAFSMDNNWHGSESRDFLTVLGKSDRNLQWPGWELLTGGPRRRRWWQPLCRDLVNPLSLPDPTILQHPLCNTASLCIACSDPTILQHTLWCSTLLCIVLFQRALFETQPSEKHLRNLPQKGWAQDSARFSYTSHRPLKSAKCNIFSSHISTQ